MKLKLDERGLIPAIAQDRLTGEVRMLAWMNEAALQATNESGLATFFSRSKGRLWQKGETSGHVLRVHRVVVDCDADTVLLLVDPEGPSCHTGARSCFFQELADEEEEAPHREVAPPLPELLELERTIAERGASTAEQSYTKSLLDAGADKIGRKLREEASELADAVAAESESRVASEAADVLYHLLVGLRLREVPVRDVLAELARRAGTSGHAEKASRGQPPAPPATTRSDPSTS